MSILPLLDPQRVAILENDAHARPALFRLRAALMGAAGYATVALLLVAGLVVFTHGVQQGRVLLAVIGLATALGGFYVVLGCLSQPVAPPIGRGIQPSEAPELFRTLEKIRRKTGAPAPDAVLVDEHYRAELLTQSRFGPFGGHRHDLVIGLPVLLTLSSSELAALLTIEHARFCRQQGWLALWLCRLRRLWNPLHDKLQQEHGVLGEFVARFYLWYIPRFQAYALPFAREQEAHAVRRAAEIIGSRATAGALAKLELFGRFHDEQYWSAYWRQAEHQADPPFGPYAGMADGYRQGERLWRSSRWLKEALARKPEYDDPAPALAEVLEQLMQEARPALPRQSAGEKWLGATLAQLVAEFDRDWLAVNRQQWQARYRNARQEDSEFNTLRQISLDMLDLNQLWRLAELTYARVGGSEARSLVEQVLQRQPDHLDARFLYGRLLLESGEERGLALLEEVMKQDQQRVDEGMRHCERYLGKRSRRHDVDAMWTRLGHYHGWVDAA